MDGTAQKAIERELSLEADFVGLHRGRMALVCGLGPSLATLVPPERFREVVRAAQRCGNPVFGVNDMVRRYGAAPTYLVLGNRPDEFTPARWQSIEQSDVTAVFACRAQDFGATPWQSTTPLCRYDFGQRCASDFSDTAVVNFGRDGTFLAAVLALHMGVDRIGVIGADFGPDHILHAEMPAVDECWRRLRVWCWRAGVDLVNLSDRSALTTLPRCEATLWLEAFESGR